MCKTRLAFDSLVILDVFLKKQYLKKKNLMALETPSPLGWRHCRSPQRGRRKEPRRAAIVVHIGNGAGCVRHLFGGMFINDVITRGGCETKHTKFCCKTIFHHFHIQRAGKKWWCVFMNICIFSFSQMRTVFAILDMFFETQTDYMAGWQIQWYKNHHCEWTRHLVIHDSVDKHSHTVLG